MANIITADDMRARYAEETLGMLCSDGPTVVNPTDLENSTRMQVALASATGQVFAYLLRGKRYTASDLISGLNAEAKAYLVDLTCRVCYWILWRKNPFRASSNGSVSDAARADYKEALEELRSGGQIFDMTDGAAADASVWEMQELGPSEIDSANMMVDKLRRKSIYPHRRHSRPPHKRGG